ncbi:DUF3789 domain-containing protein [Anaerostipes sp.]|jgi:F0F1-type ATP synthase assembly protein I|uniref:DUF3789 domain-containing protein n=1 Tax=Myoviridae sp. ctzwE5 TaxID=2825214 RepID=A0A8S5PX61_9CAUD|nr:DUF3789 domain-containing protein [Anaerostipes sp.]MED9814707.1 DUF3789 domain-containing protein [Anaerostipes sp.]DAE11099.1 MAG TPA: Protein of unknown function (DUF3789) [Myoviridae sp. ctzwE5]
MIIEFISGLVIGIVLGATVMSMCSAAKERNEL